MGGGVVASCAATRRMGGGVQFRRRRASLALGSFCDVRQRRRCDERDMPGLRLGHGGFSRDVRDARRPGSTCHRRRRAPRLPRVRRDYVQARPSRRDPRIPHEAARAERLPSEPLSFPVDSGTMRWLESESARTGIGVERIASAMILKACSDAAVIGAPARAADGGKKGGGLPTAGNS